jgi:hypothetical protein
VSAFTLDTSGTVEWRPVEGYEGLYEVSSEGRVRSLDRAIWRAGYERQIQGVVLRQKRYKDGYAYVNVYRDGVQNTRAVHRLVATAFIPNPEGKPEVNHIDGPEDRATNLEWATQQENRDHAGRHLLFPGKLGADQIIEIRRIWPTLRSGEKTATAAIYGIGARHLWKVGTGRAHRHVA